MKIFRPLDFLIILSALALGIFLTVKKASHSSAKVHVRTEDSEYEYSAKANGISFSPPDTRRKARNMSIRTGS